MPKPTRRTRPSAPDRPEVAFDWLANFGLHRSDVHRLLPALPGGLTSRNSFYVNTMIPRYIFRGREQGSIPLTPGRWYLIPIELVQAKPRLRESPLSLAAACSMVEVGPRSVSDGTVGV